MHRVADTTATGSDSIVQWLIGQWWVWTVVGVIVLVILVVLLLPASKVKASPDQPTTGREANEIALGYLQTQNDPTGAWNDPTASGVTDRVKARLVEQWGLQTRTDWLANIERLTTDRRRRDPWTSYLTVRAELGARLGREPKTKEWQRAIVEAGGDKRDAKTFVAAIEYLEQETRKAVGKKTFPPMSFVTTLDGYALGQAVALATWGVAIGHCTVEEAREIIHSINRTARTDFGSWHAFGLSYTVGRVMHWSDGRLSDKTFGKLGQGTASDFAAAVTEKRHGPWATLPWTL